MSANSDIYKHITDIEKAMSEIRLSDKKIKWYLAAFWVLTTIYICVAILFIIFVLLNT